MQQVRFNRVVAQTGSTTDPFVDGLPTQFSGVLLTADDLEHQLALELGGESPSFRYGRAPCHEHHGSVSHVSKLRGAVQVWSPNPPVMRNQH